MNYDVIVIGSGLGGLTCAARLSVLGYKVGVFEQHYIPGGYATNFKRCGYNFDVSLHGIGGLEKGGNVHNILSACNVMNKITPLKNPIAYSIHYNGELLEIPNDLQKYKELLINRFPFEEKNINKLFKDLHRFSNGFDKFILKRNKKFLDISNLDILLFIKWSYKSTYNVIKGYVNDEEFIKIFSGLWTYYGLPPKKLSAIYYFIPWISYHIHGKCYIEGGAQALSNSFVKSIEENGGKVHLKCEVESILYDDNKVYGVKLKNDEQYKCNYVVSNANPISTYNMLPKNALTNKEVKKITGDKVGCTLSQLYIGLDCSPKDLNIPEDEVFFFEGESHEDDYNRAINNKYESSGFLLTNYNSLDSKLNHENKGVITITYIDNYNYWSSNKEIYKAQKQDTTEKIIKRLEQYYKGISKHIVISELGTPRTMERYTKNPLGAVYGYGQYINQSGKNRLKGKTSIANLSFVGAWINPGGGYEGSISGGITQAIRIDKLLKDINCK